MKVKVVALSAVIVSLIWMVVLMKIQCDCAAATASADNMICQNNLARCQEDLQRFQARCCPIDVPPCPPAPEQR